METAESRLERVEPTALPTQQISVVIPAYNAAAYLAATLQSVVDQTSSAKEIIVVDDGSDDETIAIARSFDVQVVALPNGGVSAARNAGVRAATGEYIAFLDADDLWSPDKLAVQAAALAAHAGPAFSFSDYRIFDEQGIQEQSSGLRHHPTFRAVAERAMRDDRQADFVIAADDRYPVLYDSYIQPSTALVRRSDILAIGGFDETLRVHEDHEFFLRLFAIRPAVAVMRSLMLYRRHPAQASADQTAMRAGDFAVARCMSAAPHRYPLADVRYIANHQHVLYFRLGLEQARVERFDEAAQSFGKSLAARFTLRGFFAQIGARICESRAGRAGFHFLRALVKRSRRRPKG